jgi:hypothetical protein
MIKKVYIKIAETSQMLNSFLHKDFQFVIEILEICHADLSILRPSLHRECPHSPRIPTHSSS